MVGNFEPREALAEAKVAYLSDQDGDGAVSEDSFCRSLFDLGP